MRHNVIVAAMVGVLMMAAPVQAQSPDPGVGRTIWLTTADGVVHRGVVDRVTGDVIRLRIDGLLVDVPAPDVRRIETRDGVGDGMAKGAIALSAAGAVGAGYLGYATWEGGGRARYAFQVGVLGAMMGGVAGAIVGGLVDVAIPGREVLFERGTVTVTPVVTDTARSIGIRIRW